MADTRHVEFERHDPAEETRRESLMGLGNGLMFVRASAPEAALARADDPRHYPGLYLAGFYDHAERCIAGETVGITSLARLPDPFGLGWRAGDDGDWFDPDAAEPLHYRHRLDMARGLAQRELQLRDAAGRETRLEETRLVSMAHPGLALLRWRLTPLNWSGPLELRSRLATRAENSKLARTRAYEGRHLDVRPLPAQEGLAVRATTLDGRRGARVQVRLRCDAAGAQEPERGEEPEALWQQLRLAALQGETLCADLWVSVEPEDAAPGSGARPPASFDAALDAQRAAWDELWSRVHVEAPGDPEFERGCRFAAFHLLQTASPHTAARDAGLPARGWQEGYFGHVFWDELFAFPFYSLRLPGIARGLLQYRHRRLGPAREAAWRAGLRGAMYPWRSAASGAEETPAFQWIPPAHHWRHDNTRLQRHIGAAIAFNLWHHHLATDDRALLRETTGEMLVEIARFWASLAERGGGDGRWRIRGVIGPDEYHDAYPGAGEPGLDDNAYTNVMAAWTLRCARELPQRLAAGDWRQLRERCGVADGELAQWDEVSRRLRLPLLDGDVIAQFDGVERLRPPDAEPLPRRDPDVRIDWWLDAQGESVNAYQVTKQADVLMLLYLFGREGCEALFAHMGYRLAPGWAERTTRHYLDRISHESSLSRIVCAGALAEIDPEESWHQHRLALHADFGREASGSTHEGLHLGAMAGAWDVLQRRYLGLRIEADAISLEPHPPAALDDVATTVWVRGCRLRLHLRGATLRVTASSNEPEGLPLRHGGELHRLRPGLPFDLRCR